MRHELLFSLFLVLTTWLRAAGNWLSPDVISRLAVDEALETKAGALKDTVSLLELYAFAISSPQEDRAALIAMQLISHFVQDSKSKGRAEFFEFIDNYFLQSPALDGGAKRQDQLVGFIVGSKDHVVILKFLDSHVERLGGVQLSYVMRWWCQQNGEMVRKSRPLLKRLVARLRPDFYRQYHDETLAYVAPLAEAYPFNGPEFSDAIVDAYFVRIQHLGLGGSESSFVGIKHRYQYSGAKIYKSLLELVSSGTAERAQILVYKTLFHKLGSKREQDELAQAAIKHFPETREFIGRLRFQLDLQADIERDSVLSKDLTRLLEAEYRKYSKGGPLLHEMIEKAERSGRVKK